LALNKSYKAKPEKKWTVAMVFGQNKNQEDFERRKKTPGKKLNPI
jgi:hypothetical protein